MPAGGVDELCVFAKVKIFFTWLLSCAVCYGAAFSYFDPPMLGGGATATAGGTTNTTPPGLIVIPEDITNKLTDYFEDGNGIVSVHPIGTNIYAFEETTSVGASTNGLRWTTNSATPFSGNEDMEKLGNVFNLVADFGRVSRTLDPTTTWITNAMPYFTNVEDLLRIASSGSVLMGVGDAEVYRTTDGTNGVAFLMLGMAFTDIDFGNGVFVAVGIGGAYAIFDTSTNIAPTENVHTNQCLTLQVYTSGGGGGYAQTICNNWSNAGNTNSLNNTLLMNDGLNVHGVAFDGQNHVAVGTAGYVALSANGGNWTVKTFPDTYAELMAVACGGGKTLVAELTGQIYETSDYTNWTLVRTATNGFPGHAKYCPAINAFVVATHG